MRGKSPLQDETPEDDDEYMDDSMKQTDKAAMDSILMVMVDYESDMNNYSNSSAKSDSEWNVLSYHTCSITEF